MTDYIDFPIIKNPSAESSTLNKYYKINYAESSYVDERNDVKDELRKIWERLNKTVVLVHNCQNCGARLEVEENHPIFHCKYCGSTYIIGSVQPNSVY